MKDQWADSPKRFIVAELKTGESYVRIAEAWESVGDWAAVERACVKAEAAIHKTEVALPYSELSVEQAHEILKEANTVREKLQRLQRADQPGPRD